MASNPPFQLKDQTDEDFFDKLVDDEFEGGESSSKFDEGSDLDEVKGFSNLNIDDAGVVGECGVGAKVDEVNSVVNAAATDVVAEEIGLLGSSDLFKLGGVAGSDDSIKESEVVSESAAVSNSGSGVKEVQWSLFNTQSSENGNNEFESYSDFFSELGTSGGDIIGNVEDNVVGVVKTGSPDGAFKAEEFGHSASYGQHQDAQGFGTEVEQPVHTQDLSSSQDWENLYPGWRYDHSSGQWYQVDGYDVPSSNQENFNYAHTVGQTVSDGKSDVSYLQQIAQLSIDSVTECGTVASVSNFTQNSQLNNGYPEHMVFDPQYPDWYYDTIIQQWCSLEAYVPSDRTHIQNYEQHNQKDFSSTSTSLYDDIGVKDGFGKADNYDSQGFASRVQDTSWNGSVSNFYQQKENQVDNYGSLGYNVQGQGNRWSGSNNYNQATPSQVDDFGSLGHGSQGRDSGLSGSYNNNNQPAQNGFASAGIKYQNSDTNAYSKNEKTDNCNSQGFDAQVHSSHWGGSLTNSTQQHLNTLQPQTAVWGESNSYFSGNQQAKSTYELTSSINNHMEHPMSFKSTGIAQASDTINQGHVATSGLGVQNFTPGVNFSQGAVQTKFEQKQQRHFANDHYSGQYDSDFSGQGSQSVHQSYHSPSVGMERSSAGRPPHALVTFGFGGKLIVMKDNGSLSKSSYGNQEHVGGSVSILNLMEVVTKKADTLGVGMGSSDYFHSLCQHSLPGPLVSGNAGSKELNKWIDERISNCEGQHVDQRKSDTGKLLFSLLKIAYQYYGKFRSPLGADTSRESNTPESAVAKLFASAKANGAQFGQYAAPTHCLHNFPSESQMRGTASEVQSLLVAGRTKDALNFAQQGQLWGPALVLASQLGDQFYVDTVKQMALRQLIPGSPLRTLCLLIAGQPADVFSTDIMGDKGLPSTFNLNPQPAQFGSNGMLDDWEENVAVIAANRTKDDELVLFHLGDCLWKERSEITAAHICYLVAEANFESYSDSARLCLVGADHWKYPRAYASPEAIQRTELYEYSKVMGNSQFTLLSFQPYKLVYAHMLSEVGKLSDSLKYCQAVLKSIKTVRVPEVETWKQLAVSLEERIRTHQQGGYASNLAPSKIVGKLLNFFDSTTQRVVGGLPPSVPSTSHSSNQGSENYHQQVGPRVSTSQSTMVMSSLMPSASTEQINEGKSDNNRMTMHNRSVSEPNFGMIQGQAGAKDGASSNAEGKSIIGRSRFARFSFGSQLLQKTVGLVLKPRGDREAKLGETNKFYYDEKLKRWVEEGTAPPAEEAALPPPPTAAFSNGMSSYSVKNTSKNEGIQSNGFPDTKSPPHSESSSGIPPIPPGSSHFSAPGRMSVRSRYVDTFNKGGGTAANVFQSPSVPTIKSNVSANAKFFVPAPVSSVDTAVESTQETLTMDEDPSTSFRNPSSFQSPPPSSSSSSTLMQRFPSMNNVTPNNGAMGNGFGSSVLPHSRRTVSWGGQSEAFSPPKPTEVKSLGEALGMSPSSYADDLQEIEL